jgi:hypothetical protein
MKIHLSDASVNLGTDGRPWHGQAERLADWALARQVNRTDVWGGHPAGGGRVTKHGQLTRAHLVRHFRARRAGDLVGLHAADPDNRGKWAALDIDQHGDDAARAEANRAAALWWYGDLVGRGFRPLLTESNGRGGYHLRILLAEPIDAARLHHFARRLAADHRRAGLSGPPEFFPRQADVRHCHKKCGNWLRIFGKHHKRDHWPRVWDGRGWLDGAAAVAFVLSLDGDPPSLIPEAPPPPTPPRRPVVSFRGDNLSARIAAYAARLPNLAEGQGRDGVAFSFAAFLSRDLALADDVALAWLETWDRHNSPPKGSAALAEILANAKRYGRSPVGCGLSPAPRRSRRGHVILTNSREVRW